MNEKYFFDTNVLLDSPCIIKNTKNFYISNITINELENIKSSGHKDEETKYKARKVLHLLEENDENYEIVLFKPSWLEECKDLPDGNDTKIILCAKNIKDSTFVTKDLACKAIAKSLGIKVNYQKENYEDNYTGYKIVELTDDILAEFYNNILNNNINQYNLLENEYILIKSHGKIIDKYKWKDYQYINIPFYKVNTDMFGELKPKDDLQHIAIDCIANNQLSVLRGPAGSGKSYIAFSYLFSLLEHNKIDKIIIFTNTVATKGAARLGFYPGTRTEKLLDSSIGNFLESKIGDRIEVEKLIEEGHIVLLPMSDIRGYDTTGMNAAIYITEAQNLDIELMRLALQRIGEDSICILDGDDNAQVDLSLYAGDNNGLRRVSQIFKGADFYGEVKLNTVRRSKIASLAQNL